MLVDRLYFRLFSDVVHLREAAEDPEKSDDLRNEHIRVEKDHESRCAGDPLSALKAQIKRKIVSQDRSRVWERQCGNDKLPPCPREKGGRDSTISTTSEPSDT